jgi:hypothetical protein
MFAGKRNRCDVRGFGRKVSRSAVMAEPDRTDPREHTRVMEKRFRETISALRDDIKVISDPRARALFETAAEVIGGLEKAFHDYDKRDELAWS